MDLSASTAYTFHQELTNFDHARSSGFRHSPGFFLRIRRGLFTMRVGFLRCAEDFTLSAPLDAQRDPANSGLYTGP
jgi:hypothetical protein